MAKMVFNRSNPHLSVIMGIDSVEVAALCALACWLEFCGCHADHADLSLN